MFPALKWLLMAFWFCLKNQTGVLILQSSSFALAVFRPIKNKCQLLTTIKNY